MQTVAAFRVSGFAINRTIAETIQMNRHNFAGCTPVHRTSSAATMADAFSTISSAIIRPTVQPAKMKRTGRQFFFLLKKFFERNH